MPHDELKNLPNEVKALVNEGVYSLYAVKNCPGVAYALMTNTRETFALSVDGDIVPGVEVRIDDLGAPTYFAGLPSRQAAKLNYAA